jgi:syntaxin 16
MMNRDVLQREREIRAIAKSVTELAEIFQDMAKLVHEQGTILDRIDYNIETAKTHVTEGKKQLGQAATYASSARNKYCVILLVIIVAGAVFTMIVALKS